MHHLPWNLSSLLVLKSSGLRSIFFVAPKELYKFSLVTMLTLDGFGRPSETISVTMKVIWYKRKNMKFDIAINYVCSRLFFLCQYIEACLKIM